MNADEKLQRFYFDMGIKARFGLAKVRGVKPANVTWETISNSEGYLKYKAEHRMTDEDEAAFKKGFEFKEKV